MMDLGEAFKELFRIAKETAEAIQEMVEAAKYDAQKQVDRIKKTTGAIPPHRSNSRARSPCLRRYWINYRARDKLSRNGLKSGGKRKCQRKRSASRMPCLRR